MSDDEARTHPWPEEDPAPTPRDPAEHGKLARFIGDTGLTIGMSQGLGGGRSSDGNRALSNKVLFGEGEDRSKKG
jgi:hypothetical protein